MNLRCRTSVIVLMASFAAVKTASAQTSNYTIGIGAGTYIYQGDLVPGDLGSYRHLTPSLQAYAGKWINPYFQVRLSFAKGNLIANDSDYAAPAWKRERNLRFQTSVNELTVRLVFSPFGNADILPDKRLFPYLFAGAGASFLRTKRDWSGISSSFISDVKMAANVTLDSAALMPSVLLSVPFGAGITYALSPRLSLWGEAAYHLPVTDYLDGFSYLGHTDKKDNDYSIHVGVSYTLFKNNYTRCPTANKHGRTFAK